MKRTLRTIGASAAAAGLLILGLPAQPAAAATAVPIVVTADAYSTNTEGQITDDNEFLYDSSKGDTAETAYQIAYRGNLDMTDVWKTYARFKSVWKALNAGDEARWDAKTFSGDFNISFTVDPTVVSVNQDFVSCDALIPEIIKQNPGTRFGEFMRCQTTSYDETTGIYSATFKLQDLEDPNEKVTGNTLDENQPPSLHLTTPPGALYVKQSAFEAGKTFTMVDPHVDGEMTMDAFYFMMPLTYDATGEPVDLTMVQTHDALYSFESATPGRELPAAVNDLLPATDTMIRDGATVTPPQPTETSVADDQGTWTFEQWTPATATMAGEDLRFVGTWTWTVNPDATYKATHEFVSGTGGKDLPQAVLDLLPADQTVTQGQVVTPTQPEKTSVSDESAGGTWTFVGYDPASATVNAADVRFVGTWTFEATVAEVFPVTYTYVSGTDGRTLPAAVSALTPVNASAVEGDEVTPTAPAQTSVVDEQAQGTWTFQGYEPAGPVTVVGR